MKRILKTMLDRSAGVSSPVLSRLRRRKLILVYHDLFCREEEEKLSYGLPQDLCVEKQQFEKQLEWLSGFAEFVSLDDIVNGAPPGLHGKWQVALTFDDAYANVFRIGLPLLEKYRAPAVVFIPVGFTENRSHLPWWSLEYIVLEIWKGPLCFCYGGDTLQFDLDTESGRQHFRREVKKRGRDARATDAMAFRNALQDAIRQEISLPCNQLADPQLLADATDSGLIEYGSHTAHHVNVTCATRAELEKEFAESKEKIRAWTDREVRWFAYPYGKKHFQNEAAIELLEKFGFRGALTHSEKNNYPRVGSNF